MRVGAQLFRSPHDKCLAVVSNESLLAQLALITISFVRTEWFPSRTQNWI